MIFESEKSRIKKYLKSALFGVSLILAIFVFKVNAQYQIESWTTDNGLPQNTVLSIMQTRDGYLWLTTLDGLVRYDGVRFTVFNKNNTPAIINNRFNQIVEGAKGDLWVATENNSVLRYSNGEFRAFRFDDATPKSSIRKLVLNREGFPVALTESSILEWNGEGFAPYQPLAGENKDGFLFWSKTKDFWYSTGQTVFRVRNNQTSEYRLPGASDKTTVLKIIEDRRGRIWLGTNDAGLFALDGEQFTHYTTADGLPIMRAEPQIEDRNGNLWAISTRGAIVIKDGKIKTITTADALSDNAVGALFEDREGNIWIGTVYRGLNRLSRNSVDFYSKTGGLAADVVHPIFEDREGRIWIGGKSLTLYAEGKFSAVAGREKFPSGEVTAIEEDRQGRLWFGHWAGVYYLENGKFVDFTEKLGKTGVVTDIHEDRGGALWFATASGLFRYQNDAATHFTTAEGLPSNDLKVIHESAENTLWIGTYGGLTKFKDGKFISFTVENGLASNLVRSLYEDSDKVLWIGSYDGGLTRLQDGKFTRYTSFEGLFNDGVFQILEDENGWLWMSSNRGIYRVARQQLNDFAEGKINRVESTAYGKTDGLLETECNGGQQPAGIKTRDNRLWFPTQRGVAVINPKSIVTNSQPPPVVIEAVELDGTTAKIQDNSIELKPGAENLEIAYAGLSFIKPEQVRFRYKLEGLDSAWVEADARRTAYYSHLPPGEYTFTVIAANSDGVWNRQGAHLKVRVVPPFYRTLWFLSLVVFGAICLVAFVYRQRMAKLEKEKAAQQAFSRQLIESQEQERKRIAVELHDGLGQSLVVIKNRALISLNAPENHERLVAQMNEISEAASAAITEVRGIARNLHPYQIDYLGLTSALETMIESVADASGIEFSAEIDELGGLLAKEDEINLYRIVQEALNNVVKHSEATRASVRLKKNAQTLELLIDDNGKGFALDAGKQTSGLGLIGIGERAKILGAKHEIRSAPEKGTTVYLQMNLPTRKPSDLLDS